MIYRQMIFYFKTPLKKNPKEQFFKKRIQKKVGWVSHMTFNQKIIWFIGLSA